MKAADIKNIAVLGTGNMGPGIALVFVRKGYPVTMWGPTGKDTVEGRENFRMNLDDLIREDLMDPAEAGRLLEEITITDDLVRAGKDAHLVIEAIPEVLELKQDMFRKLEEICGTDTIFASNTSTLLPTPLSEKITHRERLIVAHFWNPAHLAPLVEVCGSPATSPEVVNATMQILSGVGNEPVLIRKEILGFIGNRIMHAMNREALAMIGSGVCEAGDIDRVVHSSFGPRFAHLGPMEYLDFSGLDLIRNIQGYLYPDLDNTPGVLPVIDRLVSEGNLGLKSGKGLFDWSEKENNIREKRDRELLRRVKEKVRLPQD
jgi:3-hydroxybutyryl-CoA dehydrogenase